ncbi:MAG: hypothetical protein GY845_24655, partial [Planctomycetes bacterium]|nr:hypothetical protein [Planctomycetota bacterium]
MNDSWQTCWDEPIFGGRSLEAEVDAGDTWEREQKNWTARVSINNCPQMLKESLWFLKRKQKSINNLSSVTRYVTRNGLAVVQ